MSDVEDLLREAAYERAPSVLFAGYYGFRNAGDDAFVMICQSLGLAYGVRARLLARGRHLPCGVEKAAAVLPERVSMRGATRLHAMRAVAGADALVYLGGSTLTSATVQLRDQTRARRVARVPACALGVSVGPVSHRDSSPLARALMDMRVIAVRDARSAERLADLRYPGVVHVGFDPAIRLRTLIGARMAGGRAEHFGKVTVVPAAAAEGEDRANVDGHHARLARCMKQWHRQGRSIDVVVFSSQDQRDDIAVAHRLVAQAGVDARILPYVADVAEQWRRIQQSGVVVAERLHAAIFSYALQVPFVMLAYASKGGDFAHHVGLAAAALRERGDANLEDLTDLSILDLDVSMPVERAEQLFDESQTAVFSALGFYRSG